MGDRDVLSIFVQMPMSPVVVAFSPLVLSGLKPLQAATELDYDEMQWYLVMLSVHYTFSACFYCSGPILGVADITNLALFSFG